MIPIWLHDLSIAWLLLGAACAIIIAVDITRQPQHMWIMNVVWPVTALFGTLWVLWQYFTYGRVVLHGHAQGREGKKTPFSIMVANGSLHCGSGCTLGDIAAEWLAFLAPTVAVWFGWHSILHVKMFAVWIIDYIFAYAFGILFQYFTIAPMRGLSLLPGLWAAVKADTLSLTSWQIGMYGFMAFAYFFVFGDLLGVKLAANMVEFWFMMQIAMLCGFATSYPVNWWLITAGVKEKM